MARKDFKKNNPAEAFITMPEEPIKEEASPQPTADRKPPEGYKLNPMYIEIKSKRVQLLLQPSVVEALKDLAKEKGQSMNETASEAIKAYLEREGKL